MPPAPAPASSSKTVDQCLIEFQGCTVGGTTGPSQNRTGAQNVANIKSVMDSLAPNCSDANKKYATFLDSRGLVVVPQTASCPSGMGLLPSGGRPIAGFVPCIPVGKTPQEIIGSPPAEIMEALNACRAGGGMALTTTASTATWVKPGYRMITTSSLPRQFKLKNAATGAYWIGGDGKLGEGAGVGTPIVVTPSSPADIYKVSGTDMLALNTQFGSVRHSGFIMFTQPYAPNNFDFAWKLLLKDGTTNRVIIWNPYPGNGTGMYVTGGTRPKIDAGPPTEYVIEPVTSGSGTSGYALEGSPFGGLVSGRSNTKLILILLALAILLWIVAKKM